MKTLVYGMGVIGGYLAHILCTTGHDITVLARGKQYDILKRDGLVTRSHFSRRTVTDHPAVIDALAPGDTYDIVFTVMQYEQLWNVLPTLAANASPLVVLVGNNMASVEMEAYLHQHSTVPKTVVFGFQVSGGERVEGHYTYVALGKPGMTVGSVAPAENWQPTLKKALSGAKYTLTFQDGMDDWYKSHLAFILPAAFMCYKYDCDLRRATKKDLEMLLDAASEGYQLLQHLHYQISQSDLDAFTNKRTGMRIALWVMAKTKIGELAASRHARNAVAELIALNKAFDVIKDQANDFPMPVWDQLERFMPKTPTNKP